MLRSRGSLIWVIPFLLTAGCALGGDGVTPRDRDGSVRMDGSRTDAGMTSGTDVDGDGVPAEIDCNDTDPAIGSTTERGCSSRCGEGVERCADGRWETCTAPLTCDCADGSPPRTLDCERCGTQSQVCTGGAWVNDGTCMGQGPCTPADIDMGALCGMCGRQERRCQADCTWGPWACVAEGECTAAAIETGTRACTTGCGGNETRTRTCSGACMWGAWSGWSGGCPTCGPVCGNAMCEMGETCASCADCRYGHLGTGNGGDPCTGVPTETWRCVTRSDGNRVSQVCRSGSWLNFNLTPRDCNGCVCSFSAACCQVGSPSGGC